MRAMRDTRMCLSAEANGEWRMRRGGKREREQEARANEHQLRDQEVRKKLQRTGEEE